MMFKSSDSNSLPDLDNMSTPVADNTTKPESENKFDQKKGPLSPINDHTDSLYKKDWNTKFKNHSVKMILETDFCSLNDLMLKGEHKNKYVTKVIINDDENLGIKDRQINAFKNLVTIMRDYNCCLKGLSEYLSLLIEDVIDIVENRAYNTYYPKEAIYYVLMNDCVREEGLLDYSAAKLTLFKGSMNHFCKKYGYELEDIMDNVNSAI